MGSLLCTNKKYFEAVLASYTFHVLSTEQYFCSDCQSVSDFLCHWRSHSAWKHQIIPCFHNICKPQFSLGSLLTVPMFSLPHTQHHSMPCLVFSSDLLIPILLSSRYTSMFACPARLAQLCTKVQSVFQDVSDKSSQAETMWGRQISFFTTGKWASTGCPLTSHRKKKSMNQSQHTRWQARWQFRRNLKLSRWDLSLSELLQSCF